MKHRHMRQHGMLNLIQFDKQLCASFVVVQQETKGGYSRTGEIIAVVMVVSVMVR